MARIPLAAADALYLGVRALLERGPDAFGKGNASMKHRHGKSGLVTRLGRASLILSLAAFGAGASLAGCASEARSDGEDDDDQIGALGLNLNVAPGVTINGVTY